MTCPQTTTELLDLLTKHLQPEEVTEAVKKYRYVIYARKSTDDKEKQARSLPDQIAECRDFAERNNLKLGNPDVIQEAESAKEPDTRLEFRKMLDAIKAGKYDGIITWHPDRLARNMKDAGEIIDLIDKSIIKDLKFVSFYFENSPTGKMLLGITFVLSKQYTDQLSVNVSRGNRHSVEEGKYPNRAKHGYFKDNEGHLRSDGANFVLIKTAFRMRLEGKTLDEIATFLNQSGYQRFNKKDGSHSLYKWDRKKVDIRIMRDTIYCGVLVYGKHGGHVDLTREYDFVPALSVPDFMRIHSFTNDGQLIKLARKYRKGEDVKANLARDMMICGDCGERMYPGITSKKTSTGVTRYFYFRCENDDCTRYGKSIRANVLVSFIREFIEKKPFSSRKSYDHYIREMERVAEERAMNTQSLSLSLRNRKTKLEKKMLQIREVLAGNETEELKAGYRSDYSKTSAELAEIEKDMAKTQKLLEASKSVVLTYQQFLELMDKIAQKLANTTKMAELDFAIRKLFLNFTIKDKKIVNATLSPPFDALCDLNVAFCGHGGT